MILSDSGRSAFVTKAKDRQACIEVSQPSDCLGLKREHVVCIDILVIDVWIGTGFTSAVNGPSHPEPPEVWQKALQHLLNTYDPEQCYIHTDDTETGLGDEVRVQVGAKRQRIKGYWDEKHHVLSLIR